MSNLTFLAFGISFIICVILTPISIPILHKFKFGQQVREDGPAAHLAKSGTPTMGGIVIVLAVVIGTAFFIGSGFRLVSVLIVTVCFALIGFLDDILKIAKAKSEGLKAWQKMLLQIVVTLAFIFYIAFATPLETSVIVPFIGEVDFGFWYYVMTFIAILGTVNGSNFTDGVDGLECTVTVIIALFLTYSSIVLGSGLAPAALSVTGALMAFLIFNIHPARIFMGDTGSLALGGFVASTACMMRMPIFLVLIAFIYLAEIVSVILQVVYFKATGGKRIFKMAPIHHHFELSGWSEMKVVAIFSAVTAVFCIISCFGLKLVI